MTVGCDAAVELEVDNLAVPSGPPLPRLPLGSLGLRCGNHDLCLSATTRRRFGLDSLAALEAVKRVLAGDMKPGFQTPSLAYGPDFALECEGVTREDVA